MKVFLNVYERYNTNRGMMSTDYKLVEISLGRPPSKKEKEIAKLLKTISPNDDFFFSFKENEMNLHLRLLDFNEFKSKIEELEAGEKFNEIVQKVDEIKSYGLSFGRRLYVDYNGERKVKNRQEKVEERGKYFYAKSNRFLKDNVTIPNEFENKIITGDSSEVLSKLPDNCVDLVFTSPPYNFGLDYENHNDTKDWGGYFDQLFIIFRECIRVLKYGARIVVNVQPLFSDYIPIHHIISDFFRQNKMIWRNEILWEKNNYNCKYTAWGSWKSPSNPYMKYTWEFLEVFSKGELKKSGNSTNADIDGDEFKKWVLAKWEIAPERKMKTYGHPAMFPEELAKHVWKLFSFKGDLILDPFNGAGTTSLVAYKSDRRFIGIDKSEEYNKIAEKRLKSAKSLGKQGKFTL